MEARDEETALYDSILEELLARLDDDDDPRLEDLKAVHIGHEHTAELAYRAFERYRGIRSSLQRSIGSAHPVDSGQRLGDFHIQGELARGGMSVVYRARQLSLGGRPVALKVMPREGAPLHGEKRFQREALTLAGLHHPHLAEVYGFGEERGLFFLAMRLVEGPDLGDVLEHLSKHHELLADPIVRRRIVRWVSQVAEACALVHQSGLVHRDIKPSNILIEGAVLSGVFDADKPAVLADFGLVRPIVADAATLTGGTPATPSYAPPEQLVGREVDARADVFSLGVTLHDLLSGRAASERMQASAGLEPVEELTAGIDRDLSAVVAKAVDPDPRWRYAHAAALRDDLNAWLDGEPVAARHGPWHERARHWAARHPRRIGVGALVTIGLAALAFAVLSASNFLDARRSALDAYARGDAEALVQHAARIPPALQFVLGRPVARIAQRSRAVRELEALPDDRPGRLLWYVDRGDREGVLLESATELRLVPPGGSPDPFLSGVLLAAFREAQSQPRTRPAAGASALLEARDSRSFRELGSLASALVARAFCERPVTDPAELEWSRPFREVCLLALERSQQEPQSAMREARLYAISALYGCGEVEDLKLLRQEVLPNYLAEESRLSLRASEGIVRRSHALGDNCRIQFAVLSREYESIFARTEDTALPFTWRTASAAFLRALLFAEAPCRSQRPSSFSQWLGARPATHSMSHWFGCLLAARDERVIDIVNAPDATSLSDDHGPQISDVALACALFPEQLERTHVRRVWGPRLIGERASEFERGLDSHEAIGKLPDHEPNPRARLGAPSGEQDVSANDGETWVRLPAEKISHLLSVDLDTLSLIDAATGLLSAPPELGAETSRTSWWDFSTDRPSLGGGAQSVDVRDARITSKGHNRPYLNLSTFGGSSVRLRFDARWCVGKNGLLLLSHVGASRDYLPRNGQAYIDIELNDQPLARLLVPAIDHSVATVGLPGNRLTEGDNEITIRLEPATTTTYWIHRVAVSLPDR